MTTIPPFYGLGRLPAEDTRDRQYPLRALMAEQPTRSHFYHRTGPILNQHSTGTCVGQSFRQWLSSALMMTKGGPDAFTIYREACKRDPWPENDSGDLSFGTSVRSAAQYLQSIGHIGEYRWTWSAQEMMDWLLLGKGVLICGTVWTDGMFSPDRNGLIRPTGSVAGGHAYVINGASRTRGLLRLTNSWGTGWAQNGRAWITGEDMQRLLDDDGECCTATQLEVT